MNISKAPLDDVETLSESHEVVTVASLPEEEESIQESRGDVVTTAAKFPHDDAVEEDLEEENDDKSAKAKLISMTMILMICTNILCTRQIFEYINYWLLFVLLASWSVPLQSQDGNEAML